MRATFVVALSLIVAATACASLESMIPSPQEVEALAVTVPVEGATIVLRSDDPKAQVAAGEINARIEDLGGEPLPVGEAGGGPRIVLTVGDSAPDEEQGYAISYATEGGEQVFTLEGHDPQGMLYAAVTFRHMLEVEDGRVVIRAANVRDWPDFPLRNLGEPFAEPLREHYYPMRSYAQQGEVERARERGEQHVALMQRYIDWLLRHKINMMGQMLPRHHMVDATDLEREYMRRVTDYGRARGIVGEVRANIAIGHYPEDKDNPDFADVAYHPAHERYYCWSRLEYHHEKADALAQYMKDAGIGALYLHDVDGGSWRDPALWSDRCEQCRETYGDDHAKADQVVFGLYYDAIREAVPDAIFGAVIYPYSPTHLDPDSIEADLRSEMG
ncbi:MAG: glycoside hydrolase family 20 zincin-like fold domain-containing protein, partial [Armatimonadota bacterium]